MLTGTTKLCARSGLEGEKSKKNTEIRAPVSKEQAAFPAGWQDKYKGMFMKNKTDFEKITDFGNLYKAYKKASSGNGFINSRMKFQTVALDGIWQIKQQLETKTYQISKYNEFTIYEPKERIIKVGSFKDKIVQHSLCDNVLLPMLRNEFIDNNFAGQVGKGTLYGLDILKSHILAAYSEYGMDCWIIKADIRKFFYSIDHEILIGMVRNLMLDADTLWLCEKFIDSTKGAGLPLGNQVSQVYALLYLSGLDHYITEEFGVKYYGRYMDDFYLIVQDKESAKHCLKEITRYVSGLKLELNEKTQIIPFKNGIKFCGFHTYITSDGKIIRKLKNENKRAAMKKFKKMAYLVLQDKLAKEKFYESYDSWRNHISHGNCIKLGYSMDRYIEKLMEGVIEDG